MCGEAVLDDEDGSINASGARSASTPGARTSAMGATRSSSRARSRAMPPPPPLPLPKPPQKPVKNIYEAPPRFLSTKPVQECHDIRDLVRIERDDQLRNLWRRSALRRRPTSGASWNRVESTGATTRRRQTPTPLDVRPEPPSSLYAAARVFEARGCRSSKKRQIGLRWFRSGGHSRRPTGDALTARP